MTALKNATYPFPDKNPKFLGTIIQKFRLRESKTPSAAFQKWIDEIENAVRDRLIPALRSKSMLLPKEAYTVAGLQLGKPIIQMSDFNSLIALSQKHKKPVFALTDEQLEQRGIVLKTTKKSMNRFLELYSQGADRIIALIQNA